MKRKTKLFMTFSALCLVVALGVFGILAVKTLNMSVGGNITFNAEGLDFSISDGTFETTAGAAYPGVNSDSTKLKGFAMNTNIPESEVADEKASWTGLNLTMSSLGDVVLVFTVTNNMTENLVVTITPTITGTNINSNMEIQATGGTVVKGTPSKMKITFHIKDTSINAGLTGTNFTGFSVAVNFATEGQAGGGNVPGATADNPIASTELPKLNFTPLTATTASVSNKGSTGEVVIPAYVKIGETTYTVTEIADEAFLEESLLVAVTIPNTVTRIGDYAFCETGLESVTISEGVTTICFFAFYLCNNLTSIIIPDSVTTIGPYAFSDCNSLTSVIISDSITTIEEGAFDGCSSLRSISIKATTPPTVGEKLFYGMVEFTIYVPVGKDDSYKAAAGWSDYQNHIKEEGSDNVPGATASNPIDSTELPKLTFNTSTAATVA